MLPLLGKSFFHLQGHRNLSQLPNFAFSVPLAYFLLSQQEELSEVELSQARERAAHLLQHALIMFPSGKCGGKQPQNVWLTIYAHKQWPNSQ